ncbi:MAG TPA: hypothetical protein VKK31_24575 [Thermoanaerobaculia bacterium]|nr:hypothetical protein [Thermoanaerobaculia bacterium]
MEIINGTSQEAKVRVAGGGAGVDPDHDYLCEKQEDTSRWPLVPAGGTISHSPLPPGPWTVCFVVDGRQVVSEVKYADEKVTLAPGGSTFEVKVG